MTTEYRDSPELVEAFVNENITEGCIQDPIANIIVYGNAMYVERHNPIDKYVYTQIAIRLPDDIFILNKYKSGTGAVTDRIKDAIIKSNKGKYIHIRLGTMDHKTTYGEVGPKTLRESITYVNHLSSDKSIRDALKTYGKDRMQEEAIENFNRLWIHLNSLRNPEQHKIDSATKAIIKDSIRRLQHAKRVCRMVDKYLDILTQFPELEP